MVTDEEIEEYFELFRGIDLNNNPNVKTQKLVIDLLIEIRDTVEEIKGNLSY